jgi:beta-xylosidase
MDAGADFDGSRLLVEANLPDPAVVRAGRDYYLTGTSNRNPDAFPLLRSRDLETWTEAGHIFPAGKRPAWTKPGGFFWAPEIHRVAGRYVVYYTAEDRAGKLALGAAWAKSPKGPWTDLGRPMLSNPGVGLIDGHPFRDADGRLYFYWKEDSNGLEPKKPTRLLVRELRPDGLGFKGRARRVLVNDLPWEGELVEGPWVVRRGGWYYLLYSANAFFDGRYAVGAARARSPLGPFEKKGEPILRTDERWVGPGHGMVLRRQGRDYYVHHAWRPGQVGGRDIFYGGLRPPYAEGEFGRVPLIRRLYWKGGWPYFKDAPAPARSAPVEEPILPADFRAPTAHPKVWGAPHDWMAGPAQPEIVWFRLRPDVDPAAREPLIESLLARAGLRREPHAGPAHQVLALGADGRSAMRGALALAAEELVAEVVIDEPAIPLLAEALIQPELPFPPAPPRKP